MESTLSWRCCPVRWRQYCPAPELHSTSLRLATLGPTRRTSQRISTTRLLTAQRSSHSQALRKRAPPAAVPLLDRFLSLENSLPLPRFPSSPQSYRRSLDSGKAGSQSAPPALYDVERTGHLTLTNSAIFNSTLEMQPEFHYFSHPHPNRDNSTLLGPCQLATNWRILCLTHQGSSQFD